MNSRCLPKEDQLKAMALIGVASKKSQEHNQKSVVKLEKNN